MKLEELPFALLSKELELEAQGYPERQIRAALRFAVKGAEGGAERAPPEAREATFVALVEQKLEAAAAWLDGNQRAARDGDMERGIDRAQVDGLVGRG